MKKNTKDFAQSTELPADVEARLDELLGQWAQPHRLTAAQSEQIRHAVLSSGEELGPEWWRHFHEYMHHMVGWVNDMVRVGQGDAASTYGVATWQAGWPYSKAVEGETYQLYMRLA